MTDPGWVRKEREAAFSLLTGPDSLTLPGQGSVSREFADSRYREVTSRIAATSKDLETLLDAAEQRQTAALGLKGALGWTLGAVIVLVLCIVLGQLAAAAGSSILESFNE